MDHKAGQRAKNPETDLKDYIDEKYDQDQAIQKDNHALIKLLVQGLVDHPKSVRVTPIAGEQTVVFEVLVLKDDVKRIIGRRGRIADALREILISLGAKAKKRYILEIVEPDGPRRTPKP